MNKRPQSVASNAAHAALLPPMARLAGMSLRALEQLPCDLAARAAVHFCCLPPRSRSVRQAEQKMLDAASKTHLTVDGYKLQVFSWGDGPVVVLAHGWGSSTASMTSIAKALLDQGFKVVALDAPGHGASSGWTSDMGGYARGLTALFDSIPEPHAIVAHSFGALSATLALENRHGSQPRLVLMSAQADAFTSLLQFASLLGLKQATQNAMVERFSQRLGRNARTCAFAQIGKSRKNGALFFHDKKDKLIPLARGRVAVRGIAGAVLVETQNLGHTRGLRDADVIGQIVDFLAAEQGAARSA